MSMYGLRQKLKDNKLVSVVYYRMDELFSKRMLKRKKANFRKYGIEASKQVVHCIRESTNITFFLTFGSLLGIVRDRCFMPHDDDLDFAVVEDENFSWESLDVAMEKGGFHKKHDFFFRGKVVEATYVDANDICVDFFLHGVENGRYCVYEFHRNMGQKYTSPEEHSARQMILPELIGIRSQNVYGCDYPIPANSEDFLAHFYGSGWRTPDPDWKENGYNYADCKELGYLRPSK